MLRLAFAFALFFHSTHSLFCFSPYQICSTGDCVLDASQCGSCKSGQYRCPLSTSCVNGADKYLSCPNIANTHLDPTLSVERRIDYFVKAASPAEKYKQLTNNAPAILRLGIPKFNWLNDDEHGVRNSHATMFPDGCGLGGTWSKKALRTAGSVVGYEARTLYNLNVANGDRGNENGATITLYAPNMNLVRDPRWGRSQEVYSEDPKLSGALTKEFVTGIQQGNDSNYMLAAACCKHYAAYDIESQPQQRYFFDAKVDAKNWAETYRPVFESCVVGAKGAHVMCSYNSVNGKPACGSPELLTTILRGQWNFTGFVVSDYDALAQIYDTHHYAPTMEDAVAIGLKAGCDQEGGGTRAIDQIPKAISDKKMSQSDVDLAVRRLMRVRIGLGILDPPSNVTYNMMRDRNWVEGNGNLMKARQVARESIALYKNVNNTLPFGKSDVKRLVVIGPQGTDERILLGNYATYPDKGTVSIVSGLNNVLGDVASCQLIQNTDYYVPGETGTATASAQDCCSLCYDSGRCTYFTFFGGTCYFKNSTSGKRQSAGRISGRWTNDPNSRKVHAVNGCSNVRCGSTNGFSEAVNAVSGASHVIVVLGLDQSLESEGHDRSVIELPGYQSTLVAQVKAAAKVPVVCLLVHGGTLALKNVESNCDGIVDAWYPGAQGGNAIADVIFGDFSPAGRASVTYYQSTSDLPQPGEMDLYAGNGVTYRHFTGKPMYPFGYGLSYTKFTFANLKINSASVDACDVIQVSVDVSNIGTMDGDEVVQLYVKTPSASVPAPKVRLGDFERVTIPKGKKMTVGLTLKPEYHAVTYAGGSWYDPKVMIEKGVFEIYVGPGQPDFTQGVLSTKVNVMTTKSLQQCRGY